MLNILLYNLKMIKFIVLLFYKKIFVFFFYCFNISLCHCLEHVQ